MITNSHHWILCRFHSIVILTLGVYTTVPALSLSSLLKYLETLSHYTLNPNHFLSQGFGSKNQTKPASLSKHASRVVTQFVRGSLYHFLIKNCIFTDFLNYFIVTIYFYGKVVIFVVTCFFLILIRKRP